MNIKQVLSLLGLVIVLFSTAWFAQACKKKTDGGANSAASSADQPQKIKVQHILIAFKGTIPGQERSKEDAEKLAKELFEKSKAAGADFEALVKEYSSDRPPGVYELTNFGTTAEAGSFARDQMVPAFGDVGFTLKVGEVGLANFDAQKSPFGFHIIKRLN